MSDQQFVIYRRPTPAGRTTYWTDNESTGQPSRISAVSAQRLVEIGKARWFEPAQEASE